MFVAIKSVCDFCEPTNSFIYITVIRKLRLRWFIVCTLRYSLPITGLILSSMFKLNYTFFQNYRRFFQLVLSLRSKRKQVLAFNQGVLSSVISIIRWKYECWASLATKIMIFGPSKAMFFLYEMWDVCNRLLCPHSKVNFSQKMNIHLMEPTFFV